MKQAIAYCRNEFGRDVAKRFGDSIKKQIYLLSTQPYLGQKEDLPLIGTTEFRRLVVHEYYKLLYWVDEVDGNIVIALVWHIRQKPEELSKALESRQ